MTNLEYEFKAYCHSQGINIPANIIANNSIQRFYQPGDKPSSKNGWYVLRQDGSATIGNHKTGEQWHWFSNNKPRSYHSFSLVNKLGLLRLKEQILTGVKNAEAAQIAHSEYWNASLISKEHAYLKAKQIAAHNARRHDEKLIIPISDGAMITSLQYIFPNGSKRFLPGGKIKGNYCAIGRTDDSNMVLICEGWATGVTLHELTGCPVACSLNASNLPSVAKNLKIRLPDKQFIIAGDDDHKTRNNPGKRYALQAAALINASAIFPKILNEKITDFNDIAHQLNLIPVAEATGGHPPLRSLESLNLLLSTDSSIIFSEENIK